MGCLLTRELISSIEEAQRLKLDNWIIYDDFKKVYVYDWFFS